jgi:hypothetical protein
MDIITSWMVTGFYHAGRGIAFLFFFLLRLLSYPFTVQKSPRPSRKAVRRRRSKESEEVRLAGCREVVLQYAEGLGFIARESITRDELEKLIDDGISPEELALTIQRRIDEKPGVMLGNMQPPNDRVGIKLPDSLRDRHMYIIGRSGSGKTNLIRIMAMQDIVSGNGIGMLAPEQELLTEEILPYIPEERIDDVVYFNPASALSPIPFEAYPIVKTKKSEN